METPTEENHNSWHCVSSTVQRGGGYLISWYLRTYRSEGKKNGDGTRNFSK